MGSPEELRKPLEINFVEKRERPLEGKIALITGSSRDIGAGIAVALAIEGVSVIGNYREKERRASDVNLAVRSKGGRIESVRADITNPDEREKLGLVLNESFGGKLDYLILNTSGNQQTARQVCVEANNGLADEFLSRMNEGGKIVLMQSIPARFAAQLRGLGKMPEFYDPIADAKHEGEQSLRKRIPEFREKGVSLIVVCPPEVSDSSNMRVFQRRDKSISEKHAEISDMLGVPKTVTINDVGQKVSELLKRKVLPRGYVELFGNILDARSILSQWYGDNAIFVDTLEITDEKHGVGRMIVAKEYARGHFNERVGEEVLPGHLMYEASAQTLGLIALGGKVVGDSIPMLQGVNGPIKYGKVARPGEGLKIHGEIVELASRGTKIGFVGNIIIKNMREEMVAEISGLKAVVVDKDIARRALRG